MKEDIILSIPSSEQLSNEGLARSAQAGDQEAYTTLFLQYRGETYSCIMRVVRNDEVAQDLWQDAYIKAWRRIQSLKQPSRFKPWLLTLVRNLAFDWLRRHSCEKMPLLEEAGSTPDPINHTTEPEIVTDAVINTDRVRYILAKMDPLRREILLLHVQGFSRAEIAQQLGYKESTIRTYLAEAHKQARQLDRMMNRTDEHQKEKENESNRQ